MKKANIKPGMLVTCKSAVEAYYSGFNGSPHRYFRPGMLGRVASIAPKVRITDGPGHDGADEFVVIDYVCPETQETRRASLNFCNVQHARQ